MLLEYRDAGLFGITSLFEQHFRPDSDMTRATQPLSTVVQYPLHINHTTLPHSQPVPERHLLFSFTMADEPTQPTPAPPAPSNFPGDSASTSASETAALSSAASELKISEVDTNGSSGSASTATTIAKAATVDAKKVKVDAKDVAWMVEELEVSKSRATELLKAAGGKREAAVRGFVVGEAAA